jgi:uncharacterized protein (TIGR02246 family)
MSNDEQAIRDLIQTWCRATEAGDLDSILPLMADDMIFLTPGQPPFGKAEFAAGFRAMRDRVRIQVGSEIEEIRVSGGMAWCRHRLTVRVTPLQGGDAVSKTGYALGIYRCDGGRWVLMQDANLVV